MCPKVKNHTTTKTIITSNSSFTDKLKSKIVGFHRITIAAIILYIIFVIIFVIANVLMCIWNVKINRKKYFLASKNSLLVKHELKRIGVKICTQTMTDILASNLEPEQMLVNSLISHVSSCIVFQILIPQGLR